MAVQEALRSAEAAGLDLVEVAPTAEPPVCRIMDYGKFVFEQNKKAQSARRKQKQIQVKEIKFRPGTEEGDYQVKLRNLIKFLTHGDKTKVTLRFRGREMVHQELTSQRQDFETVRRSVEESARVVRETAAILRKDFDALAQRLQYQNTVRQVREELAPLVPPGGVVAVASKGDDALLAPFGASASHFPRGDDGGYAGHYPADGDAAVRHLEDLRAGGVTHLVLPETAQWWLDAYPEFRRHLDTHYPPPVRHAGAGTLFFLSPVNNNSGNGNSAGMSSR